MIVQFREKDSRRRGWGSISGVDFAGAEAWLAAERPGKKFDFREKPARGRPKNSVKIVAAEFHIGARVTAAQKAKFDALPGQTGGEKIRRLLDSLSGV